MTYAREIKEVVLDKMFHSDLSFRQIAEETGVQVKTPEEIQSYD